MNIELPDYLRQAVERVAADEHVSPEQALLLILDRGIERTDSLQALLTLAVLLSQPGDKTTLRQAIQSLLSPEPEPNEPLRRLWDKHSSIDPEKLRKRRREVRVMLSYLLGANQAIENESIRSERHGGSYSLNDAVGALTGVYGPGYLESLRAEWP